jgi:hypothetical protein
MQSSRGCTSLSLRDTVYRDSYTLNVYHDAPEFNLESVNTERTVDRLPALFTSGERHRSSLPSQHTKFVTNWHVHTAGSLCPTLTPLHTHTHTHSACTHTHTHTCAHMCTPPTCVQLHQHTLVSMNNSPSFGRA